MKSEKPYVPVPILRFDFFLVNIGYQMDVYVRGRKVLESCRDFSGSHPIRRTAGTLHAAIHKAVDEWRKGL